MRTLTLLSLASLAALGQGCAQPTHLQYDFGRATMAAGAVQADLGRPAAARAAYPISGVEGIELRARVIEQSTDEESGTSESIQ